MSVTLGELAVRFGCELRGDPSVSVDSVGALSLAGPRAVSFLANPKYVAQLKETRAGAVILDAKSAGQSPVPALVVANPHATYARVATLLHPDPPLAPGIHAQASVERSAVVDPSSEIGAHVSIGADARIGARCYIGPGTIIERGATIGDDARLVARVFIGRGVKMGVRCIVQPGAVIGGDGFGFAPEKGTWVKVPQVGSVTIGDDVEIGANSCVDRAKTGKTVILSGAKLDNLVHVAHNVTIGYFSIVVAQAGIAGSTKIGNGVILAGQAGLMDHISIGDGARIAAQGGVIGDVPAGAVYSGYPARPHAEKMREHGALTKLPDALKKLRALEQRIAELEARK